MGDAGSGQGEVVASVNGKGERKNWISSVLKDHLRQAYEAWMQQRRYQGEIMGPAEFGEAVNTLCAGVSTYRPNEAGKRPRKYRFPELEECRSAFLSAMGGNEEEISWNS